MTVRIGSPVMVHLVVFGEQVHAFRLFHLNAICSRRSIPKPATLYLTIKGVFFVMTVEPNVAVAVSVAAPLKVGIAPVMNTQAHTVPLPQVYGFVVALSSVVAVPLMVAVST